MKSDQGYLRWAFGVLVVLMIGKALSQCTPADPKFRQYLVEGERLYVSHCSNCHQLDGKGLRRVYPPLAPSDYMDQNFENVICAMKYGLADEIVVNGNSYHQPMPGDASLTELEIAEIATYIYNSWGRQQGLVEVKGIAGILDSCKSVRAYHQ